MRRRILLVEDNPDDAELTTAALHEHAGDVEIAVAEDGVEALEYLRSEGRFADRPGALPDVVLLDLKLPRLDGLEVLRQIRSDLRTRRLPVVILTSSTEEQDLARSYDGGANSYVRKPVDFDEFARVAERLGVYWLELNRTAAPAREQGP